MPAPAASLVALTLSVVASCATPPRARPPASRDPAFDAARVCARRSQQVDRVVDGVAVVIDGTGRSVEHPIAALPPGVAEGDVLVDGEPNPRCAALMRTYVRALRALNANTGDTSNALRLQ